MIASFLTVVSETTMKCTTCGKQQIWKEELQNNDCYVGWFSLRIHKKNDDENVDFCSLECLNKFLKEIYNEQR